MKEATAKWMADKKTSTITVIAKTQLQAKIALTSEQWVSLVEDLKDILTEHLTKTRETIIEMKWYLGDRLLEEGEEAITASLERIGREIRISEAELWRCLAFRKKFPRLEEVWERAPEGKNISWHKLVNNYIDFTVPKPEIPVEEKTDTFGLLKWWIEQPDLHALRLIDKDMPFSLIIKKDKYLILVPDKHTHLREVYKELGEYFIKLKKWNPEDLNRNDYGRMNHALKELLEKAKYDKEKVKKAILWCNEQYGHKLEWGLETCIKKYAEASRPVHEFDKFLKKDKK